MPRTTCAAASTVALGCPRLICVTVACLGVFVFERELVAKDANPTAGVRVMPGAVVLRGPDAVQQVAVDRLRPGMDPIDVTREVKFEVANPKIAQVDAGGVVTPRGDGATTLYVRSGHDEARVEVKVSEIAQPPAINFANQVVPIFTKLGCNAGGCHGKLAGQNGFRLSLLGFEPTLDYETLVLEGRGRRLFPAAPDQSLLLMKATAKVPHGGGRRLEAGSHEYQIIKRWIEAGTPVGSAGDPTVASILIFPGTRVLSRGAKQQVVVTANYSDGHVEDVTRWAQYQTNDLEVAIVADGGLVETRDMAGQAAIMARYQGQVAVFRATVPLGLPIPKYPEFASKNPIDVAALKQWKALGIVPSEPATDAEFLRRASIDIAGTLPTPAEYRAFLVDPDASKRERLVDRLLERPEYASFFAIKWADILRNKRENKPELQRGTFSFYDWIRESLSENMPYDRFARSILAASGTPRTSPAVQWYRRVRTTDAYVDDTAQVFLGMRLQCARCHHHPFEKWSQDDYFGFAAFFARVGRKPSPEAIRAGRDEEIIYNARGGSVTHPKTGQVMSPKALGGPVAQVAASADPRQKLVDWMTDPANPYFARSVVNRYWAHFLGRGIVEPMDDLRVTNPPSNPELLDALSADFVKSGFDLKHLVRVICTSRLYGLSSVPNAYNAKDRQSFARHYPKRMSAEVLLDSIAQVTGVPTPFPGMPPGTRAIELPDESVVSTFLDTFGRPKRDSSCECERVTDASLGQSLMLLNSNDVQTKLASNTGRAELFVKDPRPEPEKINELFWAAFGRAASPEETARAVAHLAKHATQKRQAYEDILWALVNAKEFQFND
ncbi:MAG: DUF1549 domain-containing protein [Planctomycetota bacterium]|nr:DUF1549 domain-containing protein [Planctomycetota bacterium]